MQVRQRRCRERDETEKCGISYERASETASHQCIEKMRTEEYMGDWRMKFVYNQWRTDLLSKIHWNIAAIELFFVHHSAFVFNMNWNGAQHQKKNLHGQYVEEMSSLSITRNGTWTG